MKLIKQLAVIALLTSVSSLSSAKTLNLHEQPQADSKVVGTIQTETGVMPIFSPKNSAWVKVADPKNGNVGWVQAKELGQSGFQFNVITTDDGKQRYQTIQYGGSVAPPTREQAEKAMQEMHKRFETIQRDMNRLMQDMFTGSTLMPVPVKPAVQPVSQPAANMEKNKP